VTFGYRTVNDTAKCPKDYLHVDEVITIQKRETEKKIYIPIVDDNEWEPDLDFFVELYDPGKINNISGLPEKLNGDDTKCMITILDDDFPGSLGFAETDIVISKNAEKVSIKIVRLEGADGTISCMIRTENLSETQNPSNAEEYEDYVPKYEKVEFYQGETEKVIEISLVSKKTPQLDSKMIDDHKEEQESSEEPCDVIFKVKLEKPEPSEVKISKKKTCMVTILKSEDDEKYEEDR
jgi:solute carrier family 8 (sodium/calcium exchanger)